MGLLLRSHLSEGCRAQLLHLCINEKPNSTRRCVLWHHHLPLCPTTTDTELFIALVHALYKPHTTLLLAKPVGIATPICPSIEMNTSTQPANHSVEYKVPCTKFKHKVSNTQCVKHKLQVQSLHTVLQCFRRQPLLSVLRSWSSSCCTPPCTLQ